MGTTPDVVDATRREAGGKITSFEEVEVYKPYQVDTDPKFAHVSQIEEKINCPPVEEPGASVVEMKKPFGSLSVFPLEILYHILEELYKITSCRNLAMTNSFMMLLVEPRLYKSAFLRNTKGFLSFRQSIANHPRRASLVLQLSWEYSTFPLETDYCAPGISCRREECARLEICEGHNDLEDLSILPTFSNLRDLRLLLPKIYRRDVWRLFKNAANSCALRSLEKCTLRFFSDGVLYWELDGDKDFKFIFEHPNLKSLTLQNLSMVNFPDKQDLSNFSSSPSLQALNFLECDIVPPVLAQVLGSISELKSLQYLERLSGDVVYLVDDDHEEDYMPALLKVAHSLETLLIGSEHFPHRPLDLRSFLKLKHVSTDHYNLFDDSQGPNLARFLPPNLETLTVRGGDFMTGNLGSCLSNILGEKKSGAGFGAFRQCAVVSRGMCAAQYNLIRESFDLGVHIKALRDLRCGLFDEDVAADGPYDEVTDYSDGDIPDEEAYDEDADYSDGSYEDEDEYNVVVEPTYNHGVEDDGEDSEDDSRPRPQVSNNWNEVFGVLAMPVSEMGTDHPFHHFHGEVNDAQGEDLEEDYVYNDYYNTYDSPRSFSEAEYIEAYSL